MAWVKVDDRFFDHPKARAAGKDGRALFLAGLCHSADQLTDGLISTHDLALIAAKAEVRPRATPALLVDIGLWHGPEHDCPDCGQPPEGHLIVHNFHAYQPSAASEKARRSELSRKRAEAGRLGANARWGDSKPDGKPVATGVANGWQTDGPVPVPDSALTSTAADETNADTQRQQPALVVAKAARILAQRRADKRPDVGPGWVKQTERGIISDRQEEALELLVATPGLSPEQLADRLEPPAKPVEPSPQERMVAAQMARLSESPDPLPAPDPNAVDRVRALRSNAHVP